MGNVEVAWEDVISVIQMMRTHLIIIGIAFVCMIAALIVAKRWKKPMRGLIRWQSVFAFALIAVLTINSAVTGTIYNTLNVIKEN